MRKIALALVATIFFVSACAAPPAQPLRNVFNLADVRAELGKAAQEHKQLMIKFTGSAWCAPCHRLEENVLGTAAFRRATEGYRIVTADYPPLEERTEEKIQNDPKLAELMAIKDRYAVPGFPTIIVLAADGSVTTRVEGHSADSARTYIARLAAR